MRAVWDPFPLSDGVDMDVHDLVNQLGAVWGNPSFARSLLGSASVIYTRYHTNYDAGKSEGQLGCTYFDKWIDEKEHGMFS